MKDSDEQKLVKAFDSTEPEYILTDEGLMPITELCRADNFKWTESPMCKAAAKQWIQQNKAQVINHQLISQLRETLEQKGIPINGNAAVSEMLAMLGLSKEEAELFQEEFAEEYAALSKIPDKLNKFMLRKINVAVGRGVFFVSNAKPISEGEYVCNYSGIYSIDKKFLPYAVNLSDHYIFSAPTSSIPVNGYLDAGKYGNISRYFNDLPTEAELEEYYNIPWELREQIATANIELRTGFYQQFPCGSFVALKKITAGQLGWSYGLHYFAFAEYMQGTQRCLFYLDGRVVDSKDYQVKYLNLQFVEHNPNELLHFSFKIKDLKNLLVNNQQLLFMNPLAHQRTILSVNQLLPSILKKLFKTNNPKPADFYKFRFSCSIKLILLDFVVENSYNKNPLNQQRLNYVKKIQDALISFEGDQSDAIYTAVLNIMNDPLCKEFYITQLAAMRSEVLTVMTRYNADKKEAKKHEQVKMEVVREKPARNH